MAAQRDEAGRPAHDEAIAELTAADLLAVAGGLNPQPLPPRVEREG